MKDHFYALNQADNSLRLASQVSFKDYLIGDDRCPNPYAPIDDFLDETWSLDAASSERDRQNLATHW